jgi:hypothetical protein
MAARLRRIWLGGCVVTSRGDMAARLRVMMARLRAIISWLRGMAARLRGMDKL